ncbi:BOI-related E3 ubiquitin-protein ligase 1 isoform X2 [Mercurialis annua]|uniref:BOI-related E3 ubiquitin-protein ligase 1 isoform X2 n=1 Tax=Mercurialis annua TaxID=3986 RepID=UPI00215FDDD2|nr:BOI-related E3 ubiquitin-protein ligase 1 isoform X2 [Mercurialis annua]
MAVQAQYPSNVLLLNRNGQEGHDYPLQLQQQPAGGLFLDQSHILFTAANGGGSNTNNNNHQRKRAREVITATPPGGGGGGGGGHINQFSSSSSVMLPHHQLISLSQLHNQNQNHPSQPNVNVSTGLRLSFGHEQPPQQHNYNNYNPHQPMTGSTAFISLLSEDFSAQIKRQRDEIDQFLHAQGEQLRRTLAEKRQRHYRALLSAAEESITRKLREKETEVEKATRRNAELESRAAQLTVEAQVWQAKARAQEATAASLQAQLQQAIMSGGGSGLGAVDNRRGDDGLGCSAGGVEGQAEDAESAYVDPERVTVSSGPSCKSCRKRTATVVVLPCRHLCMCRECDQVAQACPVCLQLKNSSVEVFLH